MISEVLSACGDNALPDRPIEGGEVLSNHALATLALSTLKERGVAV